MSDAAPRHGRPVVGRDGRQDAPCDGAHRQAPDLAAPAAPAPAAPAPRDAGGPAAPPQAAPTTLDPAAPVVLVGQARSGSTLAACLLNVGAGGLMINDAYAAQIAAALGADGPAPRAEALAAFRDAALARLAKRSVAADEAPLLHRPTVLTPAMQAAAETAEGAGWAALWGAMLHGAAEAGGRAFWGWNTPPDHLRAAEIRAAFPRARFVFATRGLWPVLRSYKALPEHWGRERGRWHPALQARAWAAAGRSEARLAALAPGAVHRLEHEALLARPAETLAALAAFLGVPAFEADLAALPRNASAPGPALGRAEIWAARLALGREGRRRAGSPPAPAGLGLGALAGASVRAAGFYAAEAWRSPDMRGRLWRMARA